MQAVTLPEISPDAELAARTSLPGAVAVARDMVGGSAEFITLARSAFMDAFQLLAILAAIALSGLAIATWRVLRRAHEVR